MGAACCKSANASNNAGQGGTESTLRVMFNQFDKEKKGYISEENLRAVMIDDKTFFERQDVSHILNKYGTDGKMTFDNFKVWWGSTYTTYNDDGLGRIVEEVDNESNHMGSITELSEVPRNSNVAISRS